MNKKCVRCGLKRSNNIASPLPPTKTKHKQAGGNAAKHFDELSERKKKELLIEGTVKFLEGIDIFLRSGGYSLSYAFQQASRLHVRRQLRHHLGFVDRASPVAAPVFGTVILSVQSLLRVTQLDRKIMNYFYNKYPELKRHVDLNVASKWFSKHLMSIIKLIFGKNSESNQVDVIKMVREFLEINDKDAVVLVTSQLRDFVQIYVLETKKAQGGKSTILPLICKHCPNCGRPDVTSHPIDIDDEDVDDDDGLEFYDSAEEFEQVGRGYRQRKSELVGGKNKQSNSSEVMVRVPDSVRRTAQYAMKLQDLRFTGCTQRASELAKQLCTEQKISLNDLRYMRNWYARHANSAYPRFVSWVEAGRPKDAFWHSRRYILSWLARGGNAGFKWVNKQRNIQLLNTHFNKNYSQLILK